MGTEETKVEGKETQAQEESKDQVNPLEVLVDKVETLNSKIEDIQSKAAGDGEYLTLDDLQSLLGSVEDTQEEAEKAGEDEAVKQLKTLKAQLEQEIVNLRQQILEMRVLQEVERCRAKYSDFDNYQKEMLELSGIYPNASVEDLYLLAKAKYGEKKPNKEVEGKKEVSLDELRRMLKGEKPTGAASTGKARKGPLSLAEAAAMAAEEILKGG